MKKLLYATDPCLKNNNYYTYEFDLDCNKCNVPYFVQKFDSKNVIDFDQYRPDIIKSFTIIGHNISKISLYINDNIFQTQHFIKKQNQILRYQPIQFGIYTVAITHPGCEIKLIFNDDAKIDNAYYYGMVLDCKDRKFLATGNFDNPHLFYNNGKIYKEIRILYGMIGLDYDTKINIIKKLNDNDSKYNKCSKIKRFYQIMFDPLSLRT